MGNGCQSGLHDTADTPSDCDAVEASPHTHNVEGKTFRRTSMLQTVWASGTSVLTTLHGDPLGVPPLEMVTREYILSTVSAPVVAPCVIDRNAEDVFPMTTFESTDASDTTEPLGVPSIQYDTLPVSTDSRCAETQGPDLSETVEGHSSASPPCNAFIHPQRSDTCSTANSVLLCEADRDAAILPVWTVKRRTKRTTSIVSPPKGNISNLDAMASIGSAVESNGSLTMPFSGAFAERSTSLSYLLSQGRGQAPQLVGFGGTLDERVEPDHMNDCIVAGTTTTTMIMNRVDNVPSDSLRIDTGNLPELTLE